MSTLKVIFVENPKGVVHWRTTLRCTFSKTWLSQSQASPSVLCWTPLRSIDSISMSPHSAPATNFEQASHDMLKLLFHSTTFGALSHVHHHMSVGTSAVSRSPVTLFGMKKECTGIGWPFPAISTLCCRVKILSQHIPVRSSGTLGCKTVYSSSSANMKKAVAAFLKAFTLRD